MLNNNFPPKLSGCKHSKRVVRGNITVEIRQFNPEPPVNLSDLNMKKCAKCQEEAIETIRLNAAKAFFQGLRVSTCKIHTPLTYTDLQSSLALVLPKSMGIAIVEHKDGTQILPGKDLSVHDDDTIVVREIRPVKESDRILVHSSAFHR